MDTKIRNMLQMLQNLEIIEDSEGDEYCPVCDGEVGCCNGGYKHHEPDCELAAILYPEETKDAIADLKARKEWDKDRYKIVTITGYKFSAEEHLRRNNMATTFSPLMPYKAPDGKEVEAGIVVKSSGKVELIAPPPVFNNAYTGNDFNREIDPIICAAMQAAWDKLTWGYTKDTKGPYQKESSV